MRTVVNLAEGQRIIDGSVIETQANQVTSHHSEATVISMTKAEVDTHKLRAADGEWPMKGETRTFDGQEYVSTINYNVWTPAEYSRGWRPLEAVPEGQWAPDIKVEVGAVYTFEGGDYVALIGHTTQTDWTPPAVPALFRAVTLKTGPAPWVQPTGAQDAYPLGALVTHKGQTWENTGSPANVWEPGVFGWVVV